MIDLNFVTLHFSSYASHKLGVDTTLVDSLIHVELLSKIIAVRLLTLFKDINVCLVKRQFLIKKT